MDGLSMAIAQLRREMEQLATEKGLDAPETLQKSMELDKLLNDFQKKEDRKGKGRLL